MFANLAGRHSRASFRGPTLPSTLGSLCNLFHMEKMRLTFVLPKLFDHPIGGFKVHYQYANALARRGHLVTIVHPITDQRTMTARDWKLFIQARLREFISRGVPISWFQFDRYIKSILVPTLSSASLPAADITILTAWQTAESTVRKSEIAGAVAQIVYDYEFWMADRKLRPRIGAALSRQDVSHIATSGVVESMLREIGVEPLFVVRAGLAAGDFGVDAAIRDREQLITFAWRFGEAKDVHTALAAAELVMQELPDVRIECFGGKDGAVVPSGIHHLGRLTHSELRALYNRTSVFMLTSQYEGWGLPALEAMACGAAVVSTQSGGVNDFIDDGQNGRLVEVGDEVAVAQSVLQLLRDEDLRVTLATNGSLDAKRFSVERSTDDLEKLLRDLSKGGPSRP